MSYIFDTNIVSEFRKPRTHPNVQRWLDSTRPEQHHTSVLVIGELRHGIELKRRYDALQAGHMDRWLEAMIARLDGRILPVTLSIAEAWGHLGIPDPVPDIDGLLAATALVHGLVLVTRDDALLSLPSIRALNPFMYQQDQP